MFRKAAVLAGLSMAVMAITATTASASPRPAPHHQDHATAAVELLGGGSEQFATVNAHSPRDRYHRADLGFVDYTNFSIPGRSRVWGINPRSAEKLTVWANGNEYDHTLNWGEIQKAISNNEESFTGTGFYNPVPSDTWSVAGDVHGRNVTFTITYGPWAVPAYSASFAGQINFDGSARGTFSDVNHTTGTWSLPRHTFRTVVNYYAPLNYVKIDPRHRAAVVGFRIPRFNLFAGTEVDWSFGNFFGHKFFAQSFNHGRFFPELVESGVIDVD
jgi:hypothetical protein